MNTGLPADIHTGIRHLPQYRAVCLECLAAGRPSGNVGIRHTYSRRSTRDRVCLTCGTEWSVSHCWSCGVGQVDSRDPETPPCECGWLKCAACGACDWHGCRRRTNPYSRHFTYRDALARRTAWEDDAESGWESFVGVSRDDPDWEKMEEIAVDGLCERSQRD